MRETIELSDLAESGGFPSSFLGLGYLFALERLAAADLTLGHSFL